MTEPVALVREKRVVVHHRTGPLAGMDQIVGVLDVARTPAPSMLVPVASGQPASLITMTARAVQYREVPATPTGRLGQAMTDGFHPDQK